MLIIPDKNKRVTRINQKNFKDNWAKWKKFGDCTEDEKNQINLREIKANEIVLDIESKQYEETVEKLKILGYKSYIIIDTGSRGVHIHLFFSNLTEQGMEIRNIIRKIFIKDFNADLTKASETTLISIENRPHFKTQKNATIIENREGLNTLDNKTINEAFMFYDFNKTKKQTEEKDFKDYHKKDGFFSLFYNGKIPRNCEKNNIVFPNLAIALVKEGLTEEQIKNLVKPIIDKHYTDKNYNEFEGWLKKAINGQLEEYNKDQINQWCEKHNFRKIYETTLDVDEEVKKAKSEADENIIDYLDTVMEGWDAKKIRNNLNLVLKKIKKLKHEILVEWFINTLASRIKFNKEYLRELLNKLDEEESSIYLVDLLKQEYEDPEYFLNPLIPTYSYSIWGSKPGFGKSLTALATALHLVTKKSFIGHNVDRKCRVLYYDLENSAKITNRRCKNIVDGCKLDMNGVSKKDFLIKFNFDGENIESELDVAKNYDLIIIDSMRSAFAGNLNDSTTSRYYYNNFIKKLKNQGKAVLGIHHLRKTKQEDESKEEIMDAMRASGDITAKADVILKLYQKDNRYDHNTNQSHSTLIFKVGKLRDIYPIQDFALEVTYDENKKSTSFRYLEKSDDSEKPKDKAKQAIVDMLKEGALKRVTLVNKVKKSTNYSEGRIIKFLTELRDDGVVTQNDYGFYSINE